MRLLLAIERNRTDYNNADTKKPQQVKPSWGFFLKCAC